MPNKVAIAPLNYARENGLKQYFTGEPCKNGHVAPRWTSCNACIECVRTKGTQWRINNREAAREIVRRHRTKYPDAVKLKDKKWKKNNPDKVKAASLRFREKTRQEAKERTKLWRQQNPDRYKESKARWVANNPEKAREIYRRRKARLRAIPGNHTIDDLTEIMNMQNNKCAHCRRRFGAHRKATLDHIVPVIRGGTDYRRNLQYLCSPCNSSKGARDAIEFARNAGRLL